MARAYSLDLRKKVMSFITSGGGKREASKIFGIGEDTIYRWMRREKAGGKETDRFSSESRSRRTALLCFCAS